MKTIALVFALIYSNLAFADYCLSWLDSSRGFTGKYHVVLAKCTNTPKYEFGIIPKYTDFHSHEAALWESEDISYDQAQNDMDAQMNKIQFKKIASIGAFSIYSNSTVTLPYTEICLRNVMVATPADTEAPVQCTAGVVVNADLAAGGSTATVLESNGFTRLSTFGYGIVNMPTLDLYAK